jgi:hypothetical protein
VDGRVTPSDVARGEKLNEQLLYLLDFHAVFTGNLIFKGLMRDVFISRSALKGS